MEALRCSVGILTHNSGATLRRALESVRGFSDIIVCDGNSSDDTRAIAQEFGARVIEQSPSGLDDDGRIVDFAAVRNGMLREAREGWFFWLDSDEFISEELATEIRSVIAAGEPHAYWVPRKYTYKGKVIDAAVTYPTQQMRFFHRAVARGFIKPIHERVETIEEPRWLKNPMYVPVPESAAAMKAKWRHYLSIERSRLHAIPFLQRLYLALRESAIACMYALRLARIRLFARGAKLPLSYETARIWYQARLVAALFT